MTTGFRLHVQKALVKELGIDEKEAAKRLRQYSEIDRIAQREWPKYKELQK